jgi:hypothetical protein
MVDPTDNPTTPPYYNGDDVMQVIERYNLGFCLGNSVKYILRAGKKIDTHRLNQVPQAERDDLIRQFTLEDLNKALWYLQREIQQVESK